MLHTSDLTWSGCLANVWDLFKQQKSLTGFLCLHACVLMYFGGGLNRNNEYTFWAVQQRSWWCRGRELKRKEKLTEVLPTFFFWCWCLFSVGNDLLAARVELSKWQCCRVEALRAEADVAFFSSHVSHLGVVVPAMFSATWAGSLSVSPHVLTWFEELVLCFVEMFC